VRKILAVVIAALAGACVVYDPAAPEGVPGSDAVLELEADPDTVRPPPRSDCQANLDGCFESPLSGAPGGQPGHSRCVDCYDLCRGSGSWPNSTTYGGDCQ
jgi:hypothetical protein